MLTTYYQTADPGELEKSEYFQFYIRVEEKGGELIYFVDENHGWFKEGKRAIDHQTIFTDGFRTWKEAEKILKEHLRYLAANGFVHAFSRDPMAGDGTHYEQLDPKSL
jgi:hypothetical protein